MKEIRRKEGVGVRVRYVSVGLESKQSRESCGCVDFTLSVSGKFLFISFVALYLHSCFLLVTDLFPLVLQREGVTKAVFPPVPCSILCSCVWAPFLEQLVMHLCF